MTFHGFQKMTLLDFPGKVAATLFTGGCNFRCPFCHNALLVEKVEQTESYSEEEILNYLKKRKGLLDGVAITGGEPLLQKDMMSFIEKVKALGYAVKLDTNGSFPEKLLDIINSELVDYVAVDIKNSKEKYAQTVGISNFDITPIEKTVDILLSSGIDYEFRTTIVEEFHELEDIKNIALWIKGAKHYFLQNFVDSGNLITEGLHAVSPEKMQLMQKTASEIIPSTDLRGL